MTYGTCELCKKAFQKETGDKIEICKLCWIKTIGIERANRYLTQLFESEAKATPGPWQNTGWECPKCKRIWGPIANQCEVCNMQIANLEKVITNAPQF